jgi:hypothetical protein
LRSVDNSFEPFIVFSERSFRQLSCLLRDEVICRLSGLAGEMGTAGPKMKLFKAAFLVETTDQEREADR